MKLNQYERLEIAQAVVAASRKDYTEQIEQAHAELSELAYQAIVSPEDEARAASSDRRFVAFREEISFRIKHSLNGHVSYSHFVAKFAKARPVPVEHVHGTVFLDDDTSKKLIAKFDQWRKMTLRADEESAELRSAITNLLLQAGTFKNVQRDMPDILPFVSADIVARHTEPKPAYALVPLQSTLKTLLKKAKVEIPEAVAA